MNHLGSVLMVALAALGILGPSAESRGASASGARDGYGQNPPAWKGGKVSVLDTDHIWGVGGNAGWVWKSFVRGHNPIFMDPYDGSILGQPGDARWESVRAALGYTRRLAEQMNLAAAQPHDALASTGYCLANPGREYVIYQPKAGEAFTVQFEPGTYAYRWIDPAGGTDAGTGRMTAADGAHEFKPPFEGEAVLFLTAAANRK